MDWARDNIGLSERDLANVFKYEPKQATIVLMLTSSKQPVIWSLGTEQEWRDWIREDRPSLDGENSGLVLILAKRTGEPVFGSVKRVTSDDWLDICNEDMPPHSRIQRTVEYASLEKKSSVLNNILATPTGGRRSLRTMPFSQDTFRLVTRNFYTHNSIARVISRADIPVFSSAEIKMGEADGRTYNAYVYNSRTTNAWNMDLALTATYFPHCGLTFAILFGTSVSVEKEIIKRLSSATAEAAHPLLMPGIIAELERARHVQVVEATIDELETRIFELDFKPGDVDGVLDPEGDKRNYEKRSSWLDTTYLRNGLVSWNTQLAKMGHHAEELRLTVFRPGQHTTEVWNANLRFEGEWPSGLRYRGVTGLRGKDSQRSTLADRAEEADWHREFVKEQMRRAGYKIKVRIQEIIDEYDDKIRDCTMRVDGMAMATQWGHGETNVEIALATGRESKHMRSIALVTMVFLPGTFFASVFSMTFFSWFNPDGGPMVSGYIWIYVVVTVFFTLLTIGSWYYFVIWRRSTSRSLHPPRSRR